MAYFINSASSISHQDLFGKTNFFSDLKIILPDSELISPNYKDCIPASLLRRLSKVLKASLAASIDCRNQITDDFDSIIVGTGLGCLTDSEKFLTTIYNKQSEYISPTSFIQSTHNTISGQIALYFKNHSYNMTHTQNNVSFELSLLDAMICIKEGRSNVLVGAADEKIEFLENIRGDIIPDRYAISTLASFFSLGNIPGPENQISISAVDTIFKPTDIADEILQFLKKQKLNIEQLDIILHSNIEHELITGHSNTMNYLEYSGINYSASAFATHIAFDFLASEKKNSALIINHLFPHSLGLILLENHEQASH